MSTLNLLFGAGNMAPAATQRIASALAALPTSARPIDRAQAALELAVTAPGGAVQK